MADLPVHAPERVVAEDPSLGRAPRHTRDPRRGERALDRAQELLLPLFEWNKACPACVCGSLVLFRPAAGRVAAMVAGTQALVDAVKASGMAGAALDIAM